MKYADNATKTGKYFEPGDELDLPKAMLYGVTRAISGTETVVDKRMNRFRSAKKNWNDKAKALLDLMGIPVKTIYGTDDLQKLSEHFTGHSFHLYSRERGEKLYKPSYSTSEEGIPISLMVFQGSYAWFKPTRDRTGYIACIFCREVYKKQSIHACKNCCAKCRYPLKDCTRGENKYTKICDKCNRLFYSELCYQNHVKKLKTRHSACDVFKKCNLCEKQYTTRNGEHICGVRYCDTCNSLQPMFHQCCWVPPTEKTIEKLRLREMEYKLVIFDCETIQTRHRDKENSFLEEHYVCFLYYSLLCHQCINLEDSFNSDCEICGPNKQGYFRHNKGEPTNIVVSKFLHMLLQDRSLDNSIVIGHNAGRFDHHFLIPEMLRMQIFPLVIKRGNTIIQMNINNTPDYPCNNLKFRDSYLFINTKLSNLPKTFGFAGVKTYFPYTYCHSDSYGAQLPCLPDKRFYGARNMSPKEYREFSVWYKENRNKPFIFDDILLEYGRTDVELLHRGIVGYIKTSIALTSWNPIIQSCTFASFSFFLLKNEHIKDKMIGIIPANGYYFGQNASTIANKYLQWIEFSQGIRLQSKLNGGEKQFELEDGRIVRVDGWHAETSTAYEILGGFWHGDLDLYKPETMNPVVKKSMGDLNRETNERLTSLSKLCNLKIIWEKEIRMEQNANPELKHFMELVAHTSRLIAQDAMAGGRTQCFWMYFKATPRHKIYMLDAVSLYPSVLMKTPLPVGQPEVITENFEPIFLPLPYKGFYKLDLLPPKDLYMPVVWMRINGKLIYSLCRTCAVNEQTAVCEHTEDERKIHATLYFNELELALEEGYVILRVYEIWHWTFFQDDLYRGYIKTKLEKSGFPRENMSESDIEEWISEVFELNEGIMLERENIEKNEQLRYICKMAINSAWGKFIEKSVKSEVKFFNIHEDLPAVFDSDRHEISSISNMTEDVDMVSFQIQEEFSKPKPYTRRVELYKVLRRLKHRALYCDTDSVIFYGSLTDDRLQDVEGSHLGGWKSELNADLGEEIIEFCSCAAKVYSYKKRNKYGVVTEVTKTRGITLDKETTFDINFNSLHGLVKDLVKGKVSTITTERPTIFKKLGKIGTRMMKKQTKAVMSKLLFNESFQTRPFGWRGSSFTPINLSAPQATVLQEEDGEQSRTNSEEVQI